MILFKRDEVLAMHALCISNLMRCYGKFGCMCCLSCLLSTYPLSWGILKYEKLIILMLVKMHFCIGPRLHVIQVTAENLCGLGETISDVCCQQDFDLNSYPEP